MNELKTLRNYLKLYDDARDNTQLTAKEQREQIKELAANTIINILDIHYIDTIEINRRDWNIKVQYNNNSVKFNFFRNKCKIFNGINSMEFTIE